VVFKLFPSFVAASSAAHRTVCAGERFEDREFPASCVQVDTASVATDPNIAGSRYPGGNVGISGAVMLDYGSRRTEDI
jgi:hypothetical protein